MTGLTDADGLLADLNSSGLGSALEAVQDNLKALAKADDLERIEGMLALLQDDCPEILAKLVQLKKLPEQVRETLRVTLALENHAKLAAQKRPWHNPLPN